MQLFCLRVLQCPRGSLSIVSEDEFGQDTSCPYQEALIRWHFRGLQEIRTFKIMAVEESAHRQVILSFGRPYLDWVGVSPFEVRQRFDLII